MQQDQSVSSLAPEILDFLPIAIGIIDFKGNIIYINNRFTGIFGYDSSDLKTLEDWKKLAYPDKKYREEMLEIWEQDIQNTIKYKRNVPPKVYKISCKNDDLKHIEIKFNIYKDKIVTSFIDVTEKIKIQNDLKQSEIQYKLLFEHSGTINAFFDTECKLVIFNHDFAKFFQPNIKLMQTHKGYNPNKAYFDRLLERIENCMKLNEIATYVTYYDINNNKIWLEATYTPVKDENNEIIGVQMIANDITEQKRAEISLKESEERFKLAMEATEEGLFDWNMKTGDAYYNTRYFTMLGYKPDELPHTAETWNKLIHPDDYKYVENVVNEYFNGSRYAHEIQYRMKKKDGNWLWVLSRGKLADKDETGKPIRMIGTHLDISQKKQSEQALKESEEKYRKLVDESIEGIGISKGNKVIYANNALLNIFGYESLDEFSKIPLLDHVAPESKQFIKEMEEEIKKGKSVDNAFKYNIICKNGEIKTLEISISKLILNGELYLQSTFRDVTLEVKAEQEIKEREENFRHLAEESPNMIFINQKGKVVFANKACVEKLKYQKEEFYSDNFNFMKLMEEKSKKLIMENHQKHLNGIEVPPYEYQIISKEGEILDVIINTKIIKYNKIDSILGIVTDITERKQIEKKLETNSIQLSNAMEIAKLGYWEYDVAEDFFTFNDQFYSIFKTTVEEVGSYKMRPSEYARRFLHPDDRNIIAAEMKKALTTSDPNFSQQLEHRIIYANGEIGYISVRYFVVKDNQGRTIKTYGANQDITERKKAEEAFLEERTLLRTIVDNLPIALYIKDMETRKIICNSIDLRNIGKKKHEVLGKTDKDFLPEEVAEKTYADDQFVLNTGKSLLNKEELITNENGESRWLLSTKIPRRNHEGEIIGIIGMGLEITERKQMEEALRESEEKYRMLVENIPTVAWVSNEKGKTTYISPNVEKVYGFTQKEIYDNLDKLFFGRIHPDDIKRVKKCYINSFKNYTEYDVEYRIQRKDGEWIWLHDRANIFYKKDGITYVYGTFSDITERKKSQEQLQKSEGTLRNILNFSPDGILLNDMEGKIVECNPSVLKMHGYKSKEELIGENGLKLIASHEREIAFAHLSKLFTKDSIKDIRFSFLRKNGENFDGELSASLIKDLNGNPVGVVIIARDISARHEAEMELKNSEEKFRLIFNSSTDAIVIINRNGRYIEANDVALKRYGYTRKQFLRLTPKNIISTRYRENFPLQFKKTFEKEKFYVENEHIKSDGTIIPVEVTARKINYNNEDAVLAIYRDITERKLNQQKILNTTIQTEEKERNRIAKDLHDGVSPILSTVKLYSQSLKECKDDEMFKNIIQKIENTTDEAIQSLTEISNNLSPHLLHNFGLITAVNSFIEKVKETKNITIDFQSNFKSRLNENIEIILYRVTIELINNTLKYANANKVFIKFIKHIHLRLYYKDNGKGFDVERAFNSKKGMGLFNIKNRVESLNGDLIYESKKDEGVKINIKIPYHERQA